MIHVIASTIMFSFRIFLFGLLLWSQIFTKASDDHYPNTANLSTSWINNVSQNPSLNFSDGSKVTTILRSGTPGYAFGFYCNGKCQTYLLAIFTYDLFPEDAYPQVVWSANTNNAVGVNSTLQFAGNGDLVLRDRDGTLVWSTTTFGSSVAGLNLTEMGNLVLFDKNGVAVWQSFDHPIDCLVPGQRLTTKRTLMASVSLSNWTQGPLFLRVFSTGIAAFIDADNYQLYFHYDFDGLTSISITNGGLAFYTDSPTPSGVVHMPRPSSDRFYMKLDYDGHLKVFELREKWTLLADITANNGANDLGSCDYPLVCGEYGICKDGQCSCPTSTVDSVNYFKQKDSRQPNRGCSLVIPLTCDLANQHKWLDLDQVGYFEFEPHTKDTNISGCKEVCSYDCSCKAVIFRYRSNASSGECYSLTKIVSLNNDVGKSGYNYTASIKVQGPRNTKSTAHHIIKLSLIIGASVLAVVGIGIFVFMKKRKHGTVTSVEDPLDEVPGTRQRTDEVSFGQELGMPRKFSLEELKSATKNFTTKLGEGGFASVFRGTLADGREMAVKWLNENSQAERSFVAEVQTIGQVHHVNVVKLIGYYAGSRRMLVYEYMKNGSLDRWINWAKNGLNPLDWKCREKIILGIAKGLSYLHQDCWKKIVHLDIKPHNILLDEDFIAKISDFGLSKLMDRNQSSQFHTPGRGTPGYIAPERFPGRTMPISEKADVFAFGVMALEISCDRKVNERSLPEGESYLLDLFKKKAVEGRMSDMIPSQCEDMLSHKAEVLKMMDLAAWCLQGREASRPSMSEVVSVLEGHTDAKRDLGYDFLNPNTSSTPSPGRER